MKYIVTLNERNHRTRQITNVVCPMHIQKSMEMVIVTEGVLCMHIKEREYHIPAGSAVFVEPFDPHSYFSEVPNTCIVLEFSPEMHPLFWSWLEEHSAENRAIPLPKETYAYLRAQIPAESVIYRGFDAVKLQAILMPLCHAFLQGCDFQPAVRKKHDDTLLQALDTMLRIPPGELSLERVARQLGIRPDSLSRIFVEQADVTFHNYVQNLRVCKACALLCEGRSVSDASYGAGFGSICSFNRVFKQIMRCTPREFLKQEAKTNAFFDWEVSPLEDSLEPCVGFVVSPDELPSP